MAFGKWVDWSMVSVKKLKAAKMAFKRDNDYYNSLTGLAYHCNHPDNR